MTVVGESASEMVSVPLVERAASVSVMLTVSAESTAASLVPAMRTVTVVVVSSAALTVKVSVWVDPAANSS